MFVYPISFVLFIYVLYFFDVVQIKLRKYLPELFKRRSKVYEENNSRERAFIFNQTNESLIIDYLIKLPRTIVTGDFSTSFKSKSQKVSSP